MSRRAVERSGFARLRSSVGLLAALSLAAISGTCAGTNPPLIDVTLNGVPDEMNDLLIVPRSGFVINVSFTETLAPILPGSFKLSAYHWGDEDATELTILSADADGAVGLLPAGAALVDGSYTLGATVKDTNGQLGIGLFDFAVRDIGPSPPIATGQAFWFDFDVDRDGDLLPDFPTDLESFGLGSSADPGLSAVVAQAVRAATLARIEEAFWLSPTSGLANDPVAVDVFDFDPGAPFDTTRICVGGLDPTGGSTIGNIQIDPGNADRTSVECSSLPVPTGIFPGEMTTYGNQAAFQESFDPLQAHRGGTPVGAHALDPTVLDPGFDYGSASAAEQARYDDVFTAVERFADVLGSICAHEAGHALGLVAPGPPGNGLHGGQSGSTYAHAVTPSGGEPAGNHLMKAGPTFSFAELAGLDGSPLPAFRPLSYAYLRDRALTDPLIQALLPPPLLESVAPAVISQPAVQITVSGADLAGTPVIRLENPGFTYNASGEAWVDAQTATAWVVRSQVLPGLYDLVYVNGDGQAATLPDAVTIP